VLGFPPLPHSDLHVSRGRTLCPICTQREAPPFRDRAAYPYSMHIGTAPAIQDKRQAVLNAACAANPQRFTRRPGHPNCPLRRGSTSRSPNRT